MNINLSTIAKKTQLKEDPGPTTSIVCKQVQGVNSLPVPPDGIRNEFWKEDSYGPYQIAYTYDKSANPVLIRYRVKEDNESLDYTRDLQVYRSMDVYSTVVMAFNTGANAFWAHPNNRTSYSLLDIVAEYAPGLELSLRRAAFLNGNQGSVTNTDDHNIRCNTLNGNNGEATNGDDFFKKKRERGTKSARATRVIGAAIEAAKKELPLPIRAAVGLVNHEAQAKQVVKAVNSLGRVFKKRSRKPGVKGQGSYEVANEMTKGGSQVTGVPEFGAGSSDHSGDAIFIKKEIVTKLYVPGTGTTGTSGYGVSTFSVNPGLGGTFPWLAQIAANYTEYVIEGLMFVFVPNTGLITSGTMGWITLAADYNSANSAPMSGNEIKNLTGAVTAPPNSRIICGIEAKRSKLPAVVGSYIRIGAPPSGTDIKTYDHCKFFAGVYDINMAAFNGGSALGDLWVTYKIRLRKPKLFDSIGFAIPYDAFYATVGLNASRPLGSTPLVARGSTIGGKVTDTGVSTYTFPDNIAGVFLLQCVVTGSGTSCSLPTLIGNMDVVSELPYQNGTGVVQYFWGNTANNCNMVVTVRPAITAGGNRLNWSVTGTALTYGQMFIFALNPSLPNAGGSEYVAQS